ncbi:HU family DNA-binding protein [Crenobacter caeni]|uniref:HU family DNA-binding protein n=1 Tax=Crenobacter caeni TaxID=2705474 RepID=A0A6B2KVB6_9NEIS|nr:HU family DNA-binding protein [Crenobacter caeni]NDV14101.1 HU family DNA-binding protein [Crenobacter caeni]
MELAKELAARMNVDPSTIEEYFRQMAKLIEREISEKGEVAVPHLGRFERLTLPGGVRYDPQTRLPTMLPQTDTITFAPMIRARAYCSKVAQLNQCGVLHMF